MFPESLNYSDEQATELFADCFAVAALYDSPVASSDHYDEIRNEDKQFLFTYMYLLIQEFEDVSEEQFIAKLGDYLKDKLGADMYKKLLEQYGE